MTEIIRPVRVFVLFFYLIFSANILPWFGSRRQATRAVTPVVQLKKLYLLELKELRARVEGRSSNKSTFAHPDIESWAVFFFERIKIENKRIILAHLANMYVREYPFISVSFSNEKILLSDSI